MTAITAFMPWQFTGDGPELVFYNVGTAWRMDAAGVTSASFTERDRALCRALLVLALAKLDDEAPA